MKRKESESENEESESTRRKESEQGTATSNDRSDRVASLHRSVGNQAVQRLYRGGQLQAKLTVSQPDDKHEREADRVAEQVMRMSPSGSSVRPGVAGGIQRKGSLGGSSVDGEAKRQVESVTSGGKPLSDSTRSYFEPRFGQDFSDVRVHTGSAADEAARSIDAEAFTHGTDVVFRSEKYAPGSHEGKKLLAHELTHVVQQGSTRSSGEVQRQPVPIKGPFEGSAKKEDVSESDVREKIKQLKAYFEPKIYSLQNQLAAEVGEFKTTVNKLLEEFNSFYNEQTVKLIKRFKKEKPSFVDELVKWGAWEAAGMAADANPVTKVGYAILDFGLGYLQKYNEAVKNQVKIKESIEVADKLTSLLTKLESKSLNGVIQVVSDWSKQVGIAIGRIKEDLDELMPHFERELKEGETPKQYYDDVLQEEKDMSETLQLGTLAVDHLSKARKDIEQRSTKALKQLKALFKEWKRQQSAYKDFERGQPTRHIYWHPQTGEVAELTGDRVKPDPVMVASSPRAGGYQGAYTLEDVTEEPEKYYGKELPTGNRWTHHDLQGFKAAKKGDAQWGRNLNNNFPIHEGLDPSSKYARVYKYVGYWPEGGWHVMSKASKAPYQVVIEDGKSVAWDYDNANHPAIQAVFGRYPESAPYQQTSEELSGGGSGQYY